MNTFQDKVVVVTGAGSGIGRAIAHHFSDLGARLVLADVLQDRLETVGQELKEKQHQASIHRVDVSSKEQMEGFARQVLDRYGTVDVLINNAGVALGGELRDTTIEQFEWLMGVNFWGVIYGVNFFSPHMIERQSGHIVNISSINGIAPVPLNGPYNASKFAVLGYTRTLRMEYARLGVGVTAICPGMINTNIAKDRCGGDCDEAPLQAAIDTFTNAMATRGADPSRIARAISQAILKNKAVVKVPFDSFAVAWFQTLFPRVYEWLNCRILQGKIPKYLR